jgi:hypothetical protein
MVYGCYQIPEAYIPMGRPPIGKVAMTAAEKQRRYRERKSNRRTADRWQVLPPEGHGECDYNPEWEKAFPDDTDAMLRRNAASAQLFDIKRMLTRDFGLSRRRGAQSNEINKTWIKKVRAIKGWAEKLAVEMEQTKKGGNRP